MKNQASEIRRLKKQVKDLKAKQKTMMTHQQFISSLSHSGFGIYKNKETRKKLRSLYRIESIISKLP